MGNNQGSTTLPLIGVFTLLLLVVIGGGTLYLINTFQNNSNKISGTASVDVINQIRKTVNEIKNGEYQFDAPKEDTLYWESTDGYTIVDKTAHTIQLKTEPGVGYGAPMKNPFIKKYNSIVSDLLLQRGFIKDTLNTRESDISDVDEVAFQKGDTRCKIQRDFNTEQAPTAENPPQIAYTLTLTCADNYTQAYNEQAPYLKMAGETGGLTNIKRSGNFVYLNIFIPQGGGHYIIGKIENNTLTKIASGQDIPPCDALEQFQVPTEVYSDTCYDQNTKTELQYTGTINSTSLGWRTVTYQQYGIKMQIPSEWNVTKDVADNGNDYLYIWRKRRNLTDGSGIINIEFIHTSALTAVSEFLKTPATAPDYSHETNYQTVVIGDRQCYSLKEGEERVNTVKFYCEKNTTSAYLIEKEYDGFVPSLDKDIMEKIIARLEFL